MSKIIEGIYRNGKVELAKKPGGVKNNTRVIVTFPGSGGLDLEERGINPEHAAEIRAMLATFAEDWDRPEMSVYDDYDVAKSRT